MLYLPAILLVLSHASAQDSLTLGPTAYTAAGECPSRGYLTCDRYLSDVTIRVVLQQSNTNNHPSPASHHRFGSRELSLFRISYSLTGYQNITYGANLTNPGTISNNDTAE
jgi:hypothetical protein